MFDQKHQNLSGSLETDNGGVLIAFFFCFAAYENDHSLNKFQEIIHIKISTSVFKYIARNKKSTTVQVGIKIQKENDSQIKQFHFSY